MYWCGGRQWVQHDAAIIPEFYEIVLILFRFGLQIRVKLMQIGIVWNTLWKRLKYVFDPHLIYDDGCKI